MVAEMHQYQQKKSEEEKLEFQGFLQPEGKVRIGKSPMQNLGESLDEAFDKELENEEEDEPSGSFFEQENLQRRLELLDSQPSAIKEQIEEATPSQAELRGCIEILDQSVEASILNRGFCQEEESSGEPALNYKEILSKELSALA